MGIAATENDLNSPAKSPPRKSVGWFVGQQFRAMGAFHHEMAHGIWHRILLRSGAKRFCSLYNARARSKGLDLRVSIDPETQRCTVASKDVSVEVHPYQRATNYARGIEVRAITLGEDYLLPLVEFADGDVVIDCGANVGDFKLYFRQLGVDVEYVGIEPGPGEFEALRRNVAPSAVHNVGLWNEDGELTFYISSKGADSSLIEPPSYDSVSKVPIRRLDTLVDYPRIKLLKIEAEGAEPEALEGAQGLLDRIEYITADLGAERGVAQESTLAPVTNFLLRNGFELVALNQRRLAVLYRNTRLK
jgi:FkbM family methyltransferase